MVVVAMMHREFAQIGAGKRSRAPTTNPWIDFQGLFAVGLAAFISGATGFGNNTVKLGGFFLTHGVILACHGPKTHSTDTD